MDVYTKWKYARIFLTTIYLMLGWLLFTGTLAASSLMMGFVFSFLVACLTYSLFFDENEADRRSMLPQAHLLVVYIVILILKMYISSFQVLFNIIRGNINPRVVHFRTRVKSDIARVILANSITLTPGTITLNLDDDHLIVHWLDAETIHSKYAGKLIKGDFERLLKRIFV